MPYKKDIEFVKKFLAGDERVAVEFVNKYRPLFKKILHQFGIYDADLSNDIEQSFLLELVSNKLKKYSGRSSLSSWLYTTFTRFLINYLKSLNKSYAFFDNGLENIENTASYTGTDKSTIYKEELINTLIEVLEEKLSEEELLIITLFYNDGKKAAEIAELLDKTPRQIYHIKTKVLKFLKKELTKRGFNKKFVQHILSEETW